MEHSEGVSAGSTPGIGSVAAPKGGESRMQNSNGFSSKGVADFKPGVETTKPMVDIKHGKENSSLFKNPQDFHKEKSIFDISKPTFDEKIVQHEKAPDVGPKKNPTIDITKGEKPSIFKDINSSKNKSIIDISKPYVRSHEETYPKKDEKIHEENSIPNASQNNIYKEVKENEVFMNENVSRENIARTNQTGENETHAKNDLPFEFQVTKQEISTPQNEERNYSEVKIQNVPERTEPLTRVATPDLYETPKVLNVPKPEVSTDTEIVAQPKFQNSTIAREAENLAKVLEKPKTHSQQKELQKEALEMAPQLATEEKISIQKARTEMEKIISTKAFEKKRTAVSEKIQEKEVTKKDALLQKAKVLFLKRKAEKENLKKTQEAEKDEEGILFFEKDKEVNTFRQMAVKAAYERLVSHGQKITGANLAQEVTIAIQNGEKSELVEGLLEDKTSHEVLNNLSKIGTIENSWALDRSIREITDKNTAVKLIKESDDGAQKEDAQKVYGKALNGVEARYGEENTYGTIQELENGQVVYITQKTYSSPIAPGETSDGE